MLFRSLWLKISRNISDDDKACLFLVLVLSLVLGSGLVLGLVLVLGSGLGLSLILGLGLGSGLVLSLGLVLGKHAFLPILIMITMLLGIYAFATDPIYSANIIILVPITIITSEIIFLKDKQQPTPKHSKFLFTAKVKAESYLDVLFGWCAFAASKLAVNQLGINWKAIMDAILTYGIYPLMFFGVVGFAGIYIWLNSLKYRKNKASKTQLAASNESGNKEK
jgi:hypothetical protein